MRLLVTNDDGIDSSVLHALVRALLAAGQEIYVAAPRHEQSWVGASRQVAAGRPRATPSAPTAGSAARPGSDGTPKRLRQHRPRPPGCLGPTTSPIEGVVSGINVGLNTTLGFVLASGTLAGAWEGALHGLPGIAFSQEVTDDGYMQSMAVKSPRAASPRAELIATPLLAASASVHAALLTPALLGACPPNSFIVHNINFPLPCTAATPLRRTVPAHLLVPGLFTPQADDGTHRLIFKVGRDHSPPEPLTDRAAVEAGCISHTVLDYTRLGQLYSRSRRASARGRRPGPRSSPAWRCSRPSRSRGNARAPPRPRWPSSR